MVLPHDEAGSGPAIVLLHAGVADRGMWSDELPALAAAGYRAVAPDLPGFGDAPPGDEPDAPWADVRETLDALGIERAAMVGNSLGGGVALRLAVAAPERVTALMLVSARPVAGPPSPQLSAAREAEEAAFDRGDLDGAVQAVLDAWVLPEAAPAVRARVAVMQRRTLTLEAGRSQAAREVAPDPLEPYPKTLAGLAMPALIAVGARDMPDFARAASTLAVAIPGGRRVTIEGAGHLSPLETPEAFRELLLGFLS